MAFNRNSALKYAETYWNVPCDDGLIWRTDGKLSIEAQRKLLKAPAAEGWTPMFVKGSGDEPEKAVFRRSLRASVQEKVISDWAGLADCAHFLSRCLSAGGIKIEERGVRELVRALQARPDTKTLCERVSKERGQKVIDSGVFKPGDMLGYFNTEPEGDYNRIGYTHSTMYAGKLDLGGFGGVTCHTVARFPPNSWVPDVWWLHDGYTYTLIHFSADDLNDSRRAGQLQGWWRNQRGGSTDYIFVAKDGKAWRTASAPKSTMPVHGGIDSAYWFLRKDGGTVFTWKTGAVDVWAVSGTDPKTHRTTTDKGAPGSVTRLF